MITHFSRDKPGQRVQRTIDGEDDGEDDNDPHVVIHRGQSHPVSWLAEMAS